MDPDSMYSQLRNMCAKESVLKSCKKLIDFLEGVDLPIDNVCNINILSAVKNNIKHLCICVFNVKNAGVN